jgi:outer membrane immunogenic protein
MKKLLLAGAAALVFAAPAAAAEFTGPRIEAKVGYHHVEMDLHVSAEDVTFSADGDDNGIGYGLEAGFDFQPVENMVAGLYVGLDRSNVGQCDEIDGDEACLKMGRNITLGARVGAEVGANALLYAKGGYSNGRLKAELDLDGEENDGGKSRGGWHVGVGGEVGFGRNVYGKLEYVLSSYKRFRAEDGDDVFSFDMRRHEVMLGVGFRF